MACGFLRQSEMGLWECEIVKCGGDDNGNRGFQFLRVARGYLRMRTIERQRYE